MVASHNQYSVETAVAEMHELDLDPENSHVYFGQLLGNHMPQILALKNTDLVLN